MGRYILKLHEHYLEWSTVVDAPVTFGMTLDEFKDYYQAQYGYNGSQDLTQRLERVERKGTSSHIHDNAEDVMAGNRAGRNETSLTPEEVYQAYCLMQPVNGWICTSDGWKPSPSQRPQV